MATNKQRYLAKDNSITNRLDQSQRYCRLVTQLATWLARWCMYMIHGERDDVNDATVEEFPLSLFLWYCITTWITKKKTGTKRREMGTNELGND